MSFKYVRLNSENKVQEVVDSEIHISERFHADVVALFKEVPVNTEVEIGWVEVSEGVFELPAPPPEPEPTPE